MLERDAEGLLTALEDAFDRRYTPQQRALYLRELVRLDASAEQAQEVFRRLLRECDRLPSLRDVVVAFEAEQETTREVARSQPRSAASEARLERSVREYLAMEPLLADGELYEQFLDAMRRFQAGNITREELREIRGDLIEQARARAAEREAARR